MYENLYLVADVFCELQDVNSCSRQPVACHHQVDLHLPQLVGPVVLTLRGKVPPQKCVVAVVVNRSRAWMQAMTNNPSPGKVLRNQEESLVKASRVWRKGKQLENGKVQKKEVALVADLGCLECSHLRKIQRHLNESHILTVPMKVRLNKDLWIVSQGHGILKNSFFDFFSWPISDWGSNINISFSQKVISSVWLGRKKPMLQCFLKRLFVDKVSLFRHVPEKYGWEGRVVYSHDFRICIAVFCGT